MIKSLYSNNKYIKLLSSLKGLNITKIIYSPGAGKCG